MPDSAIKDPQALLDYQFDWSDWLSPDGDTIVSHVVTVSSGITLENSTRSSTAVIAWISGGTIGDEYEVDCLITTNAGRQDSRKMTIAIQDR